MILARCIAWEQLRFQGWNLGHGLPGFTEFENGAKPGFKYYLALARSIPTNCQRSQYTPTVLQNSSHMTLPWTWRLPARFQGNLLKRRLHHKRRQIVLALALATFIMLCTRRRSPRSGFNHQYTSQQLDFATASDNPSVSASNLTKRMKLRIAGFIRIWPTHRPGGMQSHAYALYAGLATLGHEVHVITSQHANFNSPSVDLDGRLWVHYCPNGEPESYSGEYFDCTVEICNELAPFDVIHTESNAARRFLKNANIPTVVTWHGYGYEGWRSKLNALYVAGDIRGMKELAMDFGDEYEMMAGYQHHVAISHQSASDLKEVMHIEEDRVHLILNGIDLASFEPSLAVKEDFRERHRVCENGVVLGVGGKLTSMKGSQLLRDIVPALVAFQDFPIYFAVAGVGEQLEGWEKIAANYPERVIVLGPQQPIDMVRFYQSIDLFVNPTSYYQGLDLTMQEAMACGVPIIASRTGSIQKTIMKPVNGVSPGKTFALGNAQSLHASILELGANRTALIQRGHAARLKAQREFSLSRMLSQYEDLFYSLASSSDSAPNSGKSCLADSSRSVEAVSNHTEQRGYVWHLSDLISSSICLETCALCMMTGNADDLDTLSEEVWRHIRVVQITSKNDLGTIHDNRSALCDLIYLDAHKQTHSVEEMELFNILLNKLVCGGFVFYVRSGRTGGESWPRLVNASSMQHISCSSEWCLGSFKSAMCRQSSAWSEPEDVDSRVDGEYLWSIGIFETSDFAKFNPVGTGILPALSGRDITDVRGEYMADPFVIQHEGIYMMFFEVWNVDDKRGNVGLAVSANGLTWQYERVVLREPFHMSYPYVFEVSGQYYMIPETHAVGQVRLYQSTTFPYVWKQHKVLLDEDLCDASIMYHNNIWYMFASPPSNDQVLLYFAQDLYATWQKHPSSPVLEGKEQGRPAGRIVRSTFGASGSTGWVLYVQDCSQAYGRGLNAFDVVELSSAHARLERFPNSSGMYGSKVRNAWNRHGMHHASVYVAGDRVLAAMDGWRLRPKNSQIT